MTTTIQAPPLVRTTIGKKVLVAVTGIIGILFVFGHMIGNLKVFLGPKHINDYGEWLRTLGEPALPRTVLLWIIRVVVLAAVITHITLTAQLALRSRASRQSRYADHKAVQASYASRTMRWGGAFILLFIVFHLLDLTWGPANGDFIRGDVYHNVVQSFQRPVVTAVYLVAMLCLGMHLYHGTWSVFQTLGVNRARWDRTIRRLALGIALVISVGFAVVPLGVAVGIVS